MPLVTIVAYDDCYAGSLACPQDMFHLANAYWRRHKSGNDGLFKWQILSLDGAPVTTGGGLKIIPDADLSASWNADIICIPSMDFRGYEAFRRRIRELSPLVDWLRSQAGNAILTSHCTGTFLLAETGLLAGKNATTSWWLAETFRKQYPDIHLQVDQMLVEHSKIFCGGGASSEHLIILRLIERYMGQSVALGCAKMLLLDINQLTQTPYITLQYQQGHNDQLVAEAQQWLQRHITEKFSLTKLASRLAVSPRTLTRRFKQVTGGTPNGYLQNLRIDTAKRLLESNSQTIEQTMLQVGYEDISSFSRLFQRKTKLTPREYRQKFKTF